MNTKFKLLSLIYNKTITNFIVVSSITMIVKFIGFYKEMKVGQIFGLSQLDAFYIALLVPGFVNNVFMVSFQNLFIPNYIIEQKKGINESSFLTTSLIITALLSAILIIIAFLINDFFLEDFFKGHVLGYYSLIRNQFYVIVPCIFFWSFSFLLAGLLEVNGLFKFTSFYPLITSLVTIIFLYQNIIKPNYMILPYGLLIGSLLELIYLLILSYKFQIFKFGLPNFYSSNFLILLKQFPSKVGSGFLSGSSSFINQFYAAKLIIGSMAAFNYGLKIPLFFISIFSIASGNVLLPYFSRINLDQNKDTHKTLNFIISSIFIFISFFASIFILFSEPIIQFLFERNNFSHYDTLRVSKIQMILLIQAPFYVSSVVIVKFLTSLNRNILTLYVSFLSLISSLFLNYFLSDLFGIYGMALAATLVSVVNFFFLYYFVSKQN